MTEKQLYQAFDLQRFAPSARLQAVIDASHKRTSAQELSDDELPEDGLLQSELLDSLAAALEKLPDELTDVIVLRYYDRMPLTEVALTLGMSYGAVKLRHQKALAMLRKALAD